MIFIYNHDEEQIDILEVDYIFTRELGKFNTLEFISEKEFEKGYRAVIIEKNEVYEFIFVDSEYERDETKKFTYYCQDSFIENKGNVILDKRPQGSYKVTLNSIFEKTRWEVEDAGNYSESYKQNNNFFRISVLEAFSNIVEDYKIEWYTKYKFNKSQITSRILVIGKIGKKAQSRLEFGKNIQKFSRRILPEPIITALYGYGKGEELEDGKYGRRINFSSINNGLEYITNEEARLKYGTGLRENKEHVFDFFIDENETDINNLLENTKKELQRRSQVQAEYIVEALNLNIDAEYGYSVDVIDEEINFSGTVRIIKEVINAGDIQFTFGNISKTFIDNISKEIKKSNEIVKREVTSLMTQKIKEITEDYFGEDGFNYDLKQNNEYGLPAGLYSFNKKIDENPTKAIYVGAGKMLISNGKNPDGTWNWVTAATGDGFLGEAIIANSITANKLSADINQKFELFSDTAITQRVKDGVDEYIQDRLKLDGVKNITVEYAYSRSKTECPMHGWKEGRE